MKRTISIFLAVALLTAALSVPAIASVSIGIGDDNSIDASHQIAGYSIGITPQGNGNIRVVVSVSGTHSQMTRIGFPSVSLSELNNGQWRVIESSEHLYNPRVPAGSHSYSFTVRGTVGRQYQARASFFAQDAQGFDTRGASSTIITAS
jgi:hypothetical protein